MARQRFEKLLGTLGFLNLKFLSVIPSGVILTAETAAFFSEGAVFFLSLIFFHAKPQSRKVFSPAHRQSARTRRRSGRREFISQRFPSSHPPILSSSHPPILTTLYSQYDPYAETYPPAALSARHILHSIYSSRAPA